jgi:hypothetical protein
LKQRVIPTTPNHTSVVLWIHFAGVQVLLGADLEETAAANAGWSVIVNSANNAGGLSIFI